MKYERLTNRGLFYTDSDAMDRLWELEDKIENGTLAELQCKVGDTIWYFDIYGTMDGHFKAFVESAKIAEICIREDYIAYKFFLTNPFSSEAVYSNEFEISWFKTKEQAEAKLKELRGE